MNPATTFASGTTVTTMIGTSWMAMRRHAPLARAVVGVEAGVEPAA